MHLLAFKNAVIAIVAVITLSSSQVFADTTFTYQGELKANGSAANGSFDMEFSLWNAPSGGAPIGSANTITGVPVVDGKFNVDLDFGGDAFGFTGRWLEIRINGTLLASRQSVTRTPYAIQTRGIYVNDDASFVGIGRSQPITPAEIFGLYQFTDDFSGMYIETSGALGKPFYGYSAGGDIDAYHYFDGATDKWHLFNGGITPALTVDSGGYIGIDKISPFWKLDVDGGIATTSLIEISEAGLGISQLGMIGSNLRLANFAAGDIYFGTDTTTNIAQDRMRIHADGTVIISENLGVGGTPISARLFSNGGTQHAAYFLSQQTGVWGSTSSSQVGRYGVFGQHPSGSSYGVWASGNSGASGTKSFRIDHPLDPGNKYLLHYSTESPEPLNEYSGTIKLNEHGEAWVQLPDYFETINRDLRYQLTCVGGHANVFIADEVDNNRFRIAGGRAGLKVSWEVKGVRDDLWVRSNSAPEEMEKPAELQGKYLHPELYGLTQEHAEHPKDTAAIRIDTEKHYPVKPTDVTDGANH